MTLTDSIRGLKREIDQKKERNEKIEFTRVFVVSAANMSQL